MKQRIALALALAAAACGDSGVPADVAEPAPAQTARAPEAPQANSAAATPAPSPPPASHPWSPGGYALNGAEPFWGGTVTGTSVRYMTPENQFGTLVETRVAYEAGREVFTGTLAGRPFVLTITPGPCSNGMSDHSYAFTAAVQVRGETRRGCADPQ